MNDPFLIHYYYGDRFISFKTGLGSAIRAKGHSLSVSLIIIDNSFSWLEDPSIFTNFETSFFTIKDRNSTKKILQEKTESIENKLLLIVNFDLLLEEKILPIKKFIEFINRKHTTTEIILTGELYYPQIEEIADYVSCVKSIKY